MNCRNCGAAMDLLGARRYFFCRHCGSFHFPEPLDEGVRVLRPDQGPSSCGACKGPLSAATLDEAYDIRYCTRCRGVLLARAHFAEVVERRRAWAASPPVTPSPIDRRDLQRPMTCPACAAAMSTHPYYGPGNVVLDTCSTCDLVWLDYGELTQIAEAPGRDRGRRRAPAAGAPDADAAEPDLLRLLAAQFGRRDDD